VGGIVSLLSKDFLKLVAIAAVIAFPVAWFVMHKWLLDFAYRISIQWWVFLLAGFLASAVALITIGFQAIKAAVANPVKILRSE
jgi:putative ABC transport system permease protein